MSKEEVKAKAELQTAWLSTEEVALLGANLQRLGKLFCVFFNLVIIIIIIRIIIII